MVVGQQWLRPVEFWALHPVELLWLVDSRTPKKKWGGVIHDPRVHRGRAVDASLTEDEAEACYREAFGET